MRNVWTVFTIFIFTVSCSNFNDKEYWTEEDKAIVDLIPNMVDADFILSHHDFGTTKPTIYILAELENELELTEYDSLTNTDRKRLTPLTEHKIERRKLSVDIPPQLPLLDIKLLSAVEYRNGLNERLNKESYNPALLSGYLRISRIIFDDRYEIGYVSFDFLCGVGCAWDSVIEIKKVNGHWKESRFICGGIA